MIIKHSQLFIFSGIILASLFLFSSCEESGSGASAGEDDISMVDSSETAQTRAIPSTESVDQSLVGKWKLVENRLGVNVLSMADDERSISFSPDGTLTMGAKGLDDLSGAFSQEGNFIRSEVLDIDWEINSLTATELIFKEKIDGEDVFYVYSRLP